jgi:hypothetical protein
MRCGNWVGSAGWRCGCLDGPVGGLALRTVGIGVVVIDGAGVGVACRCSVASGLCHGVLGVGSGGGQEDEALLPVGRLHVGAVIAGAGGGQLEGLDGEGEILVWSGLGRVS